MSDFIFDKDSNDGVASGVLETRAYNVVFEILSFYAINSFSIIFLLLSLTSVKFSRNTNDFVLLLK